MKSTAIQLAEVLEKYRLPELWGYAIASIEVSMRQVKEGLHWRTFPNRIKAAVITDSFEGKGLKVVLLPIPSLKPSVVHAPSSDYSITQAGLNQYLSLTGDDNPVHRTECPVIPGLLLLSFLEKNILNRPLSEFSARFHDALFQDERFTVAKNPEQEWLVKKSSGQLMLTLKLK